MNYWDNLLETDEHAASYMATYGEGPGFDTRHLIGAFINEGETILDVGCGPGWNLDHFLEHGPRFKGYRGLDYSERFVRVANERFHQKYGGPQQLSRLFFDDAGQGGPFVLGDCRKLQEPDESFDVVILQDCLEHTNGYEEPIREALRVARKRVIVTFWHMGENQESEHINDDGDDGWGAWYARPNWEKFLNSFDYVWFHTELKPEDKNHPWDFYIIDKELQ